MRHFTKYPSYIRASKGSKKFIGDGWKAFIADVESAGYSVPAEYRNKATHWIELVDADGNYCDAEVTKYSDGTYELMAHNITKSRQDYVKSSYTIPVANECVPCWQFSKTEFTGSFKELVRNIKNSLSNLGFVTSVGTSGFEPINSDTFAIDIDIQMNKDVEELSDDELNAIEDCGLEFGGKNFEI
jgi:hypothetical protein